MTRWWLADSLRRFYPRSPAENREKLQIEALRGERQSFQVVCRTGDASATISVGIAHREGIRVLVRRVGYVPMPHVNTETSEADVEGSKFLPGFVPDPLWPETTTLVGPRETSSFWITVVVGTDAAGGEHRLLATCSTAEGETVSLPVTLVVHPTVLPKRRDFPISHWLHADAIADWYRVDLFGDPFWSLLAAYVGNLVDHGSDTIYVPLFTPPLDGVKRPTQLLHVGRDGEDYTFEWSQVRRWLAVSRECGTKNFEWTHLFSQWGAEHAIRIYHGRGEDGAPLWEPEKPATGAVYQIFLRQFLPAFERFLRAEEVMERSSFHLSDEPSTPEHAANYRSARRMLRHLAPWMPVMDAVGDVGYARDGLTDVPVALLPEVPAFLAEDLPVWAYFCCVPRGRYINRLLDTPLSTIRMSGWLFYRLGVAGFLHWGYNYWYASQTKDLIDPFTVTDAKRWPEWAFGDPFVVYPGPNGPLDSIRWEVFAESLQDFALLQAAGVRRDDPLLAGIRDFADFDRDPNWIPRSRAGVMARLIQNSRP